MTVHIQTDPPYQHTVDAAQLAAAAADALKLGGPATAGVTVVITSDEAVRALNRQYRGLDAPTDVLSFEAAGDDGFVVAGERGPYLGDVIIAAPTASAQARAAGHTPAEEMTLLAVHGILHLLGFDHDTPARKKIMWQQQAQILRLHNLSHIKPTEAHP
ncbi:MAG: rRNA maturation RNase YbeY [Anaerolineae bacterium]